nr:ribonuclease H-like domain-containing protein [Tanacetum cinerariifolium]
MSDDEVPKDDTNVESGRSSDLTFSFGNPLYLHPNDTSGALIINLKLTETKIYNMWSCAMKFALRNKRATSFALKVFDKSFDDKKKGNNNYKGSNSNSANRGLNPNLKCTNCYKTGHTVDKCFDIVGYPSNYKKPNPNGQNNAKRVSSNNVVSSNNATSESIPSSYALPTLSNEQMQRLMNLLSDNPVQNVHANMTGWIVDSGTNQHMTVSTKFLNNIIDISNLGLTVGYPNGTQALITKIRDLKFNDIITLYDVLVVPEYTNLKEGKIVRTSKQSNGLYLFDVDHACKVTANNCIIKCHASKSLWHQRLGHPPEQVLLVLKEKLNLDDETISPCDTCHKAKQTREPFPLNDHKTSKISELVHLDVWGPYKVSSREGFNRNDEGRVAFDNDGTELDLSNSEEIDYVATSMEEETPWVDLSGDRGGPRPSQNFKSFCFVSALNKSIGPSTYKDAILDDNWVNDMNNEIEALNKNHTWDITKLPSGRKPIRCKWIYKIERYKARLVVKGFNQKEGIDYDETFSHVVKMVIVRNNGNKNLVCKLNKSLYVLKQASRKWNEKLVGILRENGFVQSRSDHSLFIKTVDNIFVALLVYVDDIVIIGNDENEIKRFKQFLSSKFQIKDLGLLKYFLGIEANTVLPFKPSHDNPYLDSITGYQKLVGCNVQIKGLASDGIISKVEG